MSAIVPKQHATPNRAPPKQSDRCSKQAEDNLALDNDSMKPRAPCLFLLSPAQTSPGRLS